MASPTNENAIQAALAQPNLLPPGTTAAFLEESRDGPVVAGIIFVGAFVTVILALRSFARVFIVKKFGLDDWLAVLTLLPFSAFIALCIVLIHLGSGRHFTYIQYLLTNDQMNVTEVLDFAAHIIYTSALLICRLSGLAFYARVSHRNDKFTWPLRIAAGFMIAGFLPQLFLIIFHCLPVTGYWPYSFQPEVNNYTCLQWGTVYVTNSAISMICDMILFTIPIAIITKLKCSLRRKFVLSLVLMPGLLVIAISSARMYLVVVGQWEADESWSYDYLLAVEVCEIGSTLFALSIPALKPFFGNLSTSVDRFFNSWATYVRSKSGSGGTTEQSIPTIELQPKYSSVDSDVDIRTHHRKRSGFHTGWVGEDIVVATAHKFPAEKNQFSVAALHPVDRDPSIGSDRSQQPIIRCKVEYSVSHEEAGTGQDIP